MEPITMTERESLQFGEDIQHLMAPPPPDNASSFTALLGLPAPKALQLLHSPESSESPATVSVEAHIAGIQKQHYFQASNNASFGFPSNALSERAAAENINSPGTSSSVISKPMVKNEPAETESNRNSPPPLGSNPKEENKSQISAKRKEREKKGKGSSKKSKNENSEEAEKLPYVHVRARRGQATDSHSLAERARREKINARMKLLQELVPGCNKITGTALVLDEIINHVQSLQRQVEFLSMRLAAVNPRIDFDLDGIFASESASLVNSNCPGVGMPPSWLEVQVNENRQHYEQQMNLDAFHQPVWGRDVDHQNFVTPETSLLSYDPSANSVSLHPNQVKMEL